MMRTSLLTLMFVQRKSPYFYDVAAMLNITIPPDAIEFEPEKGKRWQ